jgi:glycosyltransferase involved in cell wall biosynthesis
MKITHINLGSSYRFGGTAVATIRLHNSLRDLGVESDIICAHLDSHISGVQKIPIPGWIHRIESLLGRATRQTGLNDIHAVSSFMLKSTDTIKRADLLHLHCIHHGYFNFLSLPSLTAEKPNIYTMHDTWAFTGHCAVSYHCDRWKTGCGKCPSLDILPAVTRDNTRLEWKLKNWAYQNSDLTIVSPSNWITNMLKESMLNRFPVHQIPHGIDLDKFQPLDPECCRYTLGIPSHKAVLMFAGSFGKTKGGDILLAALNGLPNSLKEDLVLLIMGDHSVEKSTLTGIDICHIGGLSNDVIKTIAYSAADLLLFPTRGESFGLVALESIACSTPVVSFRIGGVPDIVRHGVTGYLAEPENADDFRQGIIQLLEDNALRIEMGKQGRRIALEEFSIELEAQRYKEVYEEVLNSREKSISLADEVSTRH